MKERIVNWLNSLTAKYVAVFTLLVAVPAIGISWYLLDSSYNDNKRGAHPRSSRPRRRHSQDGSTSVAGCWRPARSIQGQGREQGAQLQARRGRLSSAL